MGDNCPELDSVEGLIECTVLPPPRLYHPVLPCRVNGKLMFLLCRTCASGECQKGCDHSDEERSITGTWVSEEVKVAVREGYRIVKVHEVWQYKTTIYNPDTGEGGLFKEYIDFFLKIKQEASGFSGWCNSNKDRSRYLASFYERERIHLEGDNIKINPGMRQLAKLMLNSFWGRFGNRENLPRCSIIRTREELLSRIMAPHVEMSRLVPVNDDVVFGCWTEREDSLKPLPVYVTVIWSPPTGDYLGDLTDEVGSGSFIEEFVSGGPKNYALKIRCRSTGLYKTICKVRGITINSANEGDVSFDRLKAMVMEEAPPLDVRYQNRIGRVLPFKVVSRPETKTFRVVYSKRRRVDSFHTLPYGYKWQRLC
ncbi:hypothetical protein J437_LFUL018632 [Ladona fulva]|uniref:DNA-directed DNA polymerase n=1 Tax=Ladona fulva TaxID=123851 RepID=A0A8K0P8H9_LADFU|nr:hypothetical protein J437_LFUL018632 [Ladona fulva]